MIYFMCISSLFIFLFFFWILTCFSKQNSYNSPPSTPLNPMKTAVAAMIQGDKSAFYRCGFFGLQDTLWDVEGRHYFKLCTIQGAVDFIFGSGQSLYEVRKFNPNRPKLIASSKRQFYHIFGFFSM